VSFYHTRIRVSDEHAEVPAPVLERGPQSLHDDPDRILDAARAEAAIVRQEARDQGRREGQQQARQQVLATLEQLQSLTRSLAEERARMVRAAEADLVELVLDIARSVVQNELSARPELIVDMIRPALEHVADSSSVRLRLHPEDLALVREHAAQSAVSVPELVPDGSLERGDCMVDSNGRSVDGRVTTGLERLREHLQEHFS
jgi:flagellar assembly protein FliH